MTQAWNFGDVIDVAGEVAPADRPALVCGDRVVPWSEFVRRSNNLARGLLAGGAKPGDKIGFYMRNCPEYCEAVAAALKARLTHVNVNYRYVDDELIYLLDNADATVCVYSADFAPLVARVRDRLPLITQWVEVDDGEPGGSDVIRYETLAGEGDGRPLDIERSPDDQFFVYTGGTTGMPKGVMWRQHDLWHVQGGGGNARAGIPPSVDLDDHRKKVAANTSPVVHLVLPPLMHATGLFNAMRAMVGGGTCVTLPTRSFDPIEGLKAMERNRATNVTIVGDAFARPLLEALDANPGRYDISSVRVMVSSGVMWTQPIKQGLLRHNENMALADALGSSEAVAIGSSVTTKDEVIEVAKFTRGPNCRVFTEDLREVLPGSNEPGMVAVTGTLPLGYYKDQEKTDKTFRTIDGVRYSMPGDWVMVEADGTLTLLGRGSNCINTGGEKVYPEEVEEVLKQHDAVVDCLVVGIADEKWGQIVVAVVEPIPDAQPDEKTLREFTRQRLAAYKVPRRVLVRESVERAPNGKANYKLIKAYAESQLERSSTAA